MLVATLGQISPSFSTDLFLSFMFCKCRMSYCIYLGFFFLVIAVGTTTLLILLLIICILCNKFDQQKKLLLLIVWILYNTSDQQKKLSLCEGPLLPADEDPCFFLCVSERHYKQRCGSVIRHASNQSKCSF